MEIPNSRDRRRALLRVVDKALNVWVIGVQQLQPAVEDGEWCWWRRDGEEVVAAAGCYLRRSLFHADVRQPSGKLPKKWKFMPQKNF